MRGVVFAIGQNCNADKEVDDHDGLSWHWVIYASPDSGREAEEQDRKGDKREEEVPVATIRLIPAQAHADADVDGLKAVDGPDYAGSRMWDHKEPYVMIGRLATLEEFRGKGYGKVLVETAFEYAAGHASEMVADKEVGVWRGLVLAHAQKRLEGWYKGFGLERDVGMGVWEEEGIEHIGVWKRLTVKA